MAQPRYPLDSEQNLGINLEQLFMQLSIIPNDNDKAGNFDGKVIDCTLTSGSPYSIQHNLERTPVGAIMLSQSAHGSVITVSKDEDTMVVQSDADMDVTLMVL